MYSETIDALAQQAAAKLDGERRSIFAHLIRSMLAGMYVGAAIILIFTIGGSRAGDAGQRHRWCNLCRSGVLAGEPQSTARSRAGERARGNAAGGIADLRRSREVNA